MPEVTLEYLTRGKRVIPLTWQYAHLCITDVKLPDLVLSNHGGQTIVPTAIEVAGYADEARVVLYTPPVTPLYDIIRQAHPQFRRLLTDDREPLLAGFGDLQIDHAHLSETEQIPPGQCALLWLSRLIAVHHVGSDPLTRLEIAVTLNADGRRETLTIPVTLSHAASDITYHFPLRGLVRVGNLAGNYAFHRQCHSQEFAFDIVGICQDAGGQLVTHIGKALSDYPIYRRPVLAVADGVVVAAGDDYPEEETILPSAWSPAASQAHMTNLRQRIGYQQALGGNFLIIRHGAHEFSYYAHLSRHTQQVRAGDAVVAGQEIARVGSTGNSSEPHLHFQLMDDADFFIANGLPIMFAEIPAAQMNQCFTAANALVGADELFLTIEEEHTG